MPIYLWLNFFKRKANYQGELLVVVHPSALRPIPRVVSTLGTILGLLFLILVVGVIRPGTSDGSGIELSYFGVVELDSAKRTPVVLSSIRSSSVSVQLELTPVPRVANERGAIFFRRPDGRIFPVVAESWVERAGNRTTSIFVTPADALLLIQLASQGQFLWKKLEVDQESPYRAELERRARVLIGQPHPSVASHLQTSEGQSANLPSPEINPSSAQAPVGTHSSVIWFPGEARSYLISAGGEIDIRNEDGTTTRLRR